MTIEIKAQQCCNEIEIHTSGCCSGHETKEKDSTQKRTTESETDRMDIRSVVKTRYREAALAAGNSGSGCGCGCSSSESDEQLTFVGTEYDGISGYEEEADLGLGCGVPTELAGIRPGDSILDLGSGAGVDAFIARRETGPDGRVIGVDFTPEMVDRARANAKHLGHDNVEFYVGDIEALPLDDSLVDVVISNCVLNLVPDKPRVFSEMYRVLRPGGHFCVSDIVFDGVLPDGMRRSAEMYAGCVSGAIELGEYVSQLTASGFEEVTVRNTREIDVPDETLLSSATPEEVALFRKSGRIMSVTVTGIRPGDPT